MLYMAKKKKKLNLYVNVDADLKERMLALAEKHDRKLNAEVTRALRRYLAEEEPKVGITSPDSANGE
jgi:predicted transcriptional regulator